MKAYILSAGLGTRLYPQTLKTPKVMLPIGDKPLLWYQIKLLNFYKVTRVMINLHRNSDVITEYFGDGKKFGAKIFYANEDRLLGTAGSVNNAEDFFNEDTFLVFYGDNLTNFNINKLLTFHKKNMGIVTIGLYKNVKPWTAGMVIKDKNGKVKKFVEKPNRNNIESNEVSAGIYVFEPRIFKYFPKQNFSDFGHDIFPKLILKEKVFALNTLDYVQDIGTPKRYEKAKEDFKNGLIKFPFDNNR